MRPVLVHPAQIAFCITDLDPGGAERALVQLVTRLDRSRFSPHVICLARPGELVATLQAAEIPVTCLGGGHRWDIAVVVRLIRELRQIRPVLLQTFLFHANLAGRLAAWPARIGHVVSGIRVAERRRNSYLRLDRWTQSLVEMHVCVSQAVASFSRLEGRLDPQKLRVIPNGVDYPRFANAKPLDLGRWNVGSEDDVWMTVGRLDLQKGPWELLEAVEVLRSRYPRLKLLWAGEGPLRKPMQQWLEAHGLQSVVQLIGWQTDIPGLLRAVRGFVLGSRWEGMPNVILEALAAGLPVVSTNVEGVSEIITNGETGWILGEGETIADGWNRALQHPERSAQLAQAGQVHVHTHFTWDVMARRYMDLYEELLGRS